MDATSAGLALATRLFPAHGYVEALGAFSLRDGASAHAELGWRPASAWTLFTQAYYRGNDFGLGAGVRGEF